MRTRSTLMPCSAKKVFARCQKEAARGLFAFVGQNLAVREPGVIVDGCVDEAVADDGAAAPTRIGGGLPIAGGLLAGHDPMSAAVGNVAELLDVDVDRFAGTRSFVAADDLTGGPVHPAQPVQAVAGQDAVDRRAGYAQDRADPCRAELAVAP
ncbi:hypothetical protein ADK43_03050 [Streptomyces rimosus subsp. rimosus]|nr:hypothetical protein ADK43_03050 [Streptomyces rimosus subsp. rimosus]